MTLFAVDSKTHIVLMKGIGLLSLFMLPFIIFQLSSLPWIYLLLAVVSVVLITKFGQAIGQHRYFSHNSFATNKFWHNALAILATLSGTGTVIHYAAIHRAHHRFSDTMQDPHSPYYNGFIKTWFADIDGDISKKIPKKIVVDLMRDPLLRRLHDYYWYLLLGYVIVLGLIDPTLVLVMFLLPIGYSRFCTGLQATISHRFGYRNFDTSDNSTNNLVVNILSLGEGSHNNHHHKQTEYNFGYTGKLQELDLSAFLIKYIINGKKYAS